MRETVAGEARSEKGAVIGHWCNKRNKVIIYHIMKKIFAILSICAIAVSAMAMPARRDGIVRTAADGTEKMVYQHGDESFHYMTDAEGNWLDEETLLPLSEEAKAVRKTKGKARIQQRRIQQQRQETGVDRLLSPRGAVILVSYSDKAFQSSHEDMTQWAKGDTYTYNGATGSIRRYFLDQSWGTYDLDIDVIGPVKVSKTAAYYGKNDYSGNDQHADELVAEACKIAHDSLGADFSQYDFNNDGKVDWVVILYAGKGEADGGTSTTIWPHQYDLSYTNMQFKLDGKTIDHYCCLNEIDGQTGKRTGIATFCHEFSHVMGLPDFYETNDEYSWKGLHTLCEWDVMDYGPYNNNGNTPPNYSAYERWFMGWITPTLISDAASVVLPDLSDSKAAVLLTANGTNVSNVLNPTPKTFYLLENRQKTGWDKYLPGEGLLITKISYNRTNWMYNQVNNSASAMGVDLMEAKTNTSNRGKITDAYPDGATSFTKITNYQVTNIDLKDGIITFDVNGGGEEILLDVETVQDGEEKARKIIRDGQVVIIRGGKEYNIIGALLH